MTEQIKPTKQGQIVRIFNPLPDEDGTKEYLLAVNPEEFEDNDSLLIYPVSEVQRTAVTGGIPFGDHVPKRDLTVIGESLEEWVKSWNK